MWVVYDLCLVDELKALRVSSKAFEERLEKSRIDVLKTKSAVPGRIAPVSALYKKSRSVPGGVISCSLQAVKESMHV